MPGFLALLLILALLLLLRVVLPSLPPRRGQIGDRGVLGTGVNPVRRCGVPRIIKCAKASPQERRENDREIKATFE
uniref:Putative secreted protein n=1 Tax=Anopheles darlingi TaxID=43151 RepID=A0A2M4D087_ANODA